MMNDKKRILILLKILDKMQEDKRKRKKSWRTYYDNL